MVEVPRVGSLPGLCFAEVECRGSEKLSKVAVTGDALRDAWLYEFKKL